MNTQSVVHDTAHSARHHGARARVVVGTVRCTANVLLCCFQVSQALRVWFF